jgi:hypothetical protein
MRSTSKYGSKSGSAAVWSLVSTLSWKIQTIRNMVHRLVLFVDGERARLYSR